MFEYCKKEKDILKGEVEHIMDVCLFMMKDDDKLL